MHKMAIRNNFVAVQIPTAQNYLPWETARGLWLKSLDLEKTKYGDTIHRDQSCIKHQD